MPAPFGVKRFTIDSTMEMPADGYSAEASSSAVFLQAADTDQITLEAGFLDPATQTPYTVRHVEGNIDEYEIVMTPAGLHARISGRDKANELLDRPYKKLYLRKAPQGISGPIGISPGGTQEIQGIPYVVGTFKASSVAKDVVEAAGLSMQWECRDYVLLEDFEATGRSFDILRRLVEPWSQVEMFKVDIFVQGSVVFFRARAGTFIPDYTFTAKDARIKSLTVRRRRATRYGKVTLEGELVPIGATGGGVNQIQSGEVDEVNTSETRDAAGNVTGRSITTKTYRVPDRIPLRSLERQYLVESGGMTLVKEEERVNEYEDSQYDFSGPSNQPRLLSKRSLTRGIHPQDKAKTFREVQKEEISFSYDTEGFQDMTTTTSYTLNVTKGVLEEKERIVKTLTEIENLKVEEVTSTYAPDKNGKLFLQRIDTQISAGLRPGGIRPPRSIVSGGVGQKQPVKLEKTISTHPKAVDVRYSNPHLTGPAISGSGGIVLPGGQTDLDVIMNQFTQASGKWEWDLTILYVAMPWLRKGSVLSITNAFVEDGVTLVPLQPALIVDQNLTFDESSESPEMVSRLRAVFWTD